MTPAESRALLRAAGVLLLVSAVRLGMEARRGEPIFPADSTGILPGLTEATAAAREDEQRRSRPLAPSERLDPNRASAADLDRLPGVGPATADEIVQERETRGAFRSTDELVRVRGIGASTLARIRPHVQVSNVPVSLRSPASGSPRFPAKRAKSVDVNRADSVELQRLPGIGPSLARRIVEYRSRHGPFRRPDELLNVKGIGPATLAKLTAFVTVQR